MYAQITSIRVPMGSMDRMRAIIQRDYLPKIRVRPGFVSAFLMEQVDDRDRAELVILWESQAALEKFNSTGLLEASVQSLAAHLPGAQVQRQGYALTVSTAATLQATEDVQPLAVQNH
jgi:quinol monooxygenase YgiN